MYRRSLEQKTEPIALLDKGDKLIYALKELDDSAVFCPSPSLHRDLDPSPDRFSKTGCRPWPKWTDWGFLYRRLSPRSGQDVSGEVRLYSGNEQRIAH
jgi:hypothetical protein